MRLREVGRPAIMCAAIRWLKRWAHSASVSSTPSCFLVTVWMVAILSQTSRALSRLHRGGLGPHVLFLLGKETFHMLHFRPRNRLRSVWGFPTRTTRVGWYLISLEDPRLAPRADRNSSVTARRVAPGLQKWPGDGLLAATGPIRGSPAAAPW